MIIVAPALVCAGTLVRSAAVGIVMIIVAPAEERKWRVMQGIVLVLVRHVVRHQGRAAGHCIRGAASGVRKRELRGAARNTAGWEPH